MYSIDYTAVARLDAPQTFLAQQTYTVGPIINGDAARTNTLARNSVTNTAGNSLTVNAGGATVAATDKAGGQLILGGGLSTGTGESGTTLQGCVASGTGTTDNAQQDMVKVLGNKLAFYNATPITKPAITGSKTSGAAWVSILAQGVALGLWTDSTDV